MAIVESKGMGELMPQEMKNGADRMGKLMPEGMDQLVAGGIGDLMVEGMDGTVA